MGKADILGIERHSAYSNAVCGSASGNQRRRKYCLAYYADGDTSFADYPAAGVMQALQPSEPIYVFQKYFGVGFEIVPAIALRYLGLPAKYEFEFRHLLCALLGWLLMLCAGLMGRELGGWRLGIVCLLIVACTPTMFGWSVQDAKDTPFAAGFAVAVLGFLRIFKSFPKIKPLDATAAAAGIAIAVSVRIGGLMLPFYALAGLGLWAACHPRRIRQVKWTAIAIGFGVCAAGALAGLCMYPNFFYAGPIAHIRDALGFVHNHPLSVMMLWDGRFISAAALPPFYLWKAYGLTLPPFAVIGAALCLIFCKRIIKNYSRFPLLFLAFATAFPIAYLLASQSPIYQGWKHTMFVYASFVPFIALGYWAGAQWAAARLAKMLPRRPFICAMAGWAAFGTCLLPAAVWMGRNIHYCYAYYNAFAGNVYGRYDQDHLFTAVSRCFEWLVKNELTDTSRRYVVASVSFGLGGYQASKQYPNIEVKAIDELHYTSNDCDYAILHTKCISRSTLRHWWTPKGTLHTENIDGHPVCAVIKKNPDEAEGVRLLQAGEYAPALAKLQAAYEYSPNSIDLYYWLGLAYYMLEDYENAIAFFAKDANIKSKQAVYGSDNPVLQAEALMYIGQARMAQGRHSEALQSFRSVEYAYNAKKYAAPAETLANCGLCYYYLRQYPQAALYLEQIVDQYPHLMGVLQECRAANL